MDMRRDKDFFEIYLDKFPDAPSLVIVRSVEAKNFPKEYIKDPVLDLCCGDGFFASVLGLNGIYGCDIDKFALTKAAESGVYKEVIYCDARTLKDYPEDFFNTVIANCALEHIDGINQAIASISRVLRKDGFLIMTVPSDNLLRWFSGNLVKYNERQKHINIMPLTDWEIILNNNSLMIEKYFYLFDEKQYKRVIFLDSLPEQLPKLVFAVYYRILRITPKFIKKLVIVAKKNEK